MEPYQVPGDDFKALIKDRDRIKAAIDLLSELIALDEKVRAEARGESALGPDLECFKVVRTGLHQMESERNSRIAALIKKIGEFIEEHPLVTNQSRVLGPIQDDYPRFKTRDEAVAYSDQDWGIAVIHHIVQEEDGRFSVMAHINVEWCDYCTEKNQNPSLVLEAKYFTSGPHRYRSDPYQDQRRAEEEYARAQRQERVEFLTKAVPKEE